MNSNGRLWIHRFALLTANCTFPLIFAGGLVTSTGAALAIPDWPTNYGFFLLPREHWIGNVIYEYGHRVIGAIVGLLTITLAVWIWFREPRRSVRWLALAAVVAVCIQGIIGGMRVVLVNHFPALSAKLPILHACLAQGFFAIAISLAQLTSPRWFSSASTTSSPPPYFRTVCLATTVLVYLQIFLGALTRHTTAGATAHIITAFLVLAAAIAVLSVAMNHCPKDATVTRPALLLGALLLAQLFLGFASLLLRSQRQPDLPATASQALVPTAHVALGALIFATSVILTLRAYQATNGASVSKANISSAPAHPTT